MTGRTCPVPECRNVLGTTRTGAPYLLCSRHWHKLPLGLMAKLWRAYRAWQRLERQRARLRAQPDYHADSPASKALLDAVAIAMSEYLDVRADCIRAVRDPDVQLELAQ